MTTNEMKKHITILLLCFLSITTIPSHAQVSDKNEAQIQAVENLNKMKKEFAEIEKKIAEAKKNKEDPETIKTMEDQLAMMKEMVATMEDLTKDLLKTSDNTVKQTLDDNKETVPKRDSKRINMLPDGILTDAELVVFAKKIHSEVERLLPVKYKTEAQKIYTDAKSQKRSPAFVANITNSLWMVGYNEIAIYILGKECVAGMSNTNNLNNYAAFLSMAGAEHAAIPILQNLHKKYPGSYTILNNLGQAWYGLGDMNNANRYLDSTIKIYPRHSQANLTKSEIQKAEGKTQESIESIKRSIQDNYTPEKEARLTKLGGKLEYDDVPFRYKMKPEPLGIEKFILTIPEYIMDGGMPAANNEMEWNDFNEKIKNVENNINDQIRTLRVKADAYNARFLANPMILKPYNNSVYRTAKRKMDLLFEWVADRAPRLGKKMKEAEDSVDKWHIEYHTAVNAHKEYNNTRGIPGDCGVLKSLAVAFNTKSNTLWQQRNSELLSFHKQFLNTWSNLSLYAATDKSQYDLWIATIKKGFLGQLGNLHHETEVGCMPATPEEQHGKILPDFDSLTCQYKDEIFIPPFTTIKTECNKMSTEFDIDTELGLKIKVGWEEDLNRNKITKGTLELGVEAGVDDHLGPIKGELKAEAGIGIEVTETGVKEAFIKAGVSGELSGHAQGYIDPKGSAVANMEIKSSWSAGSRSREGTIGTSLSGEGVLKNINWSTPSIKSK